MPIMVNRGPWLVDVYGQPLDYSYVDILVKPDSPKRIKPVPLSMANMTGRTVYRMREDRVIYKPFKQIEYNPDAVLNAGFERSADPSRALASAVSKLRGKIKAESANLAVFAAEFRQACNLFVSLAGQLYQGYKAVRRGHLVDAYRDLSRDRGFSKKWIEFQFGLVPLVGDMESLCNSLADGLREGIRLRAVASGHDSETYTRTFRDNYGNLATQFELHEIMVRLKAEYTISDVTLRNVSQFGFYNIPATAWELIPFSFVVDYCIDVGGWLSNLDALNGISNLVYSQGIKTTSNAIRSVDVQSQAARTKYVTLARSGPGTSLGIPLPAWSPSDSYKKVLNGLALLRLLGRS